MQSLRRLVQAIDHRAQGAAAVTVLGRARMQHQEFRADGKPTLQFAAECRYRAGTDDRVLGSQVDQIAAMDGQRVQVVDLPQATEFPRVAGIDLGLAPLPGTAGKNLESTTPQLFRALSGKSE